MISAQPYLRGDGSFDFSTLPITWRQNTTSRQYGLRGSFETGAVLHRWTISALNFTRRSGADFHTHDAGEDGQGTSSIYRPTVIPRPGINNGDPRDPLAWRERNEFPSVALSDTLSIWQDQVQLTLGVRHQKVRSDNATSLPGLTLSAEHYEQSINSPMLGLVLKPLNNVSLYANHIQGLTQGDVAQYGTVNQGQAFAPYRTRQFETGVKVNWGQFVSTLSLFQITKPYANIDAASNALVVDGEQRHRGLEINLSGELVKGARVLGGATFIDASVQDSSASGLTRKQTPVGVAKRSLVLGGEWDVAPVPGLTLTARAVHNSDVYADASNLTRVPGWTVYDLGVRYALRAAGTPILLRAGLENAFDKRYWKQGQFSASAGMPRTLLVSSTFAF